MSEYDKIKILWIEDERLDQRQGSFLPDKFKEYFEVSYKMPSGGMMLIRSSDEYCSLLEEYIRDGHTTEGNNDSIFPVEIIRADYDLSKYTKHGDDYDDNKGKENFTGFLLQLIHSLHFQSHPTAIVSATMKGIDLSKDYPSIVRINRFLENNYHASIDLSSKAKKDWEIDIERGVIALRNSIESLYLERTINLSFKDLKAIYNGTGEILTIRSKHAIRKLPIRGLFMNYNDGSWRAEAQKWAEDLFMDIITEGHIESIIKAEQIAKEIWDGYNNDELFDKRWELSKLCSNMEDINDTEKERLVELVEFFGINKKYSSCSRNTVDLRNYNIDDTTRRWVALFVLLHLLGLVATAQKKWREAASKTTNMLGFDSIAVEDWLLALYPIAESPVILPFSEFYSIAKNRLNKMDSWLIKFKQRTSAPLKFKDVLSGKSNSLSSAERRILLGKSLDMPGLTKDDWSQCRLAQSIFYGKANNE